MKEKIISLLFRRKIPMSIGAIAKRLNSNEKTISLHLLELEKEKLIKSMEAEIIIRQNGVIRTVEKIQKIKLYFIEGEKNGST